MSRKKEIWEIDDKALKHSIDGKHKAYLAILRLHDVS